MIIVFSPFDFEKLCLKGGLDGLDFPFTIPRTISDRLSGGAKKSLVVQKALYITNGHFFGLCPKKVLRLERRGPLLFQNVLSLFNGQNKPKCHDFVSRTFSSLPFNGHFSSKTWHPLSKNFSCS